MPTDRPPAMTHAVEMEQVQKEYAGRAGTVQALAAIDLVIEDSEFAVLLGPSGCGKSTLLNLLAGFEQPTGGHLRVFGDEVMAPGPDRAVVFQEAALFPWLSAHDNVAFSLRLRGMNRREIDAQVGAALAQVGLTQFARALPDQLSGGMKQRVGIARALVMEPRVLLMDEPFGALDAQTRLSMQELLLGVWERRRKTVLFITHDIDEAILLADTLYVMSARPGRIKARIPVDLPRPRSLEMLSSAEFNPLRREIMHLIRDDHAHAQS
jgi:NitT/TauT family transport system ATP-binding protein